MTTEQTEKQTLYTQVVEKAWVDSDFKKALVANPVDAIAKETGKKIQVPEGKTLVVVDQSEANNIKQEDDKTYFIIPENTQKDFELTEGELETVAGGLTFVIKTDKHGNFDGIDWDFTLF